MLIPRISPALTLLFCWSSAVALHCHLPDDLERFDQNQPPLESRGLPATASGLPPDAVMQPDHHASELSRIYGSSTWENPDWAPGDNNDRARAARPADRHLSVPDAGAPESESASALQSQAAPGVTGIPVLCYHQLEAGDKSYGGYNVSPERFEEQLRYLSRAGYQSLNQAQLVDLLAGRAQPGRDGVPERGVVLSFDDGLISHYRVAAPLLKRYGFRGVLFLYPTVLDSKRAAYMNWEQARELVESGVFEVGSHSLYHPYLPELSSKRLASQMRDSRKILERKLGVSVRSFAYPFGVYDRRVIAAARDADYELAFTINTGGVRPGPPFSETDRLTLNRYMVTRGDDLKRFRSYLKLESPRNVTLQPPDGSHIRPGASFRLELPDVRAESVRVRLGKRNLKLAVDPLNPGGTAFQGRLPEFKSSRGYLPLEVRATLQDGTRIFQRFLYLDAAKF